MAGLILLFSATDNISISLFSNNSQGMSLKARGLVFCKIHLKSRY